MTTKNLITITGPSTAGKSTLAELFKEQGYQEIVSTTTRPQRTGEINGVNYYFVNDKEFSELIKNDQLVEYATVGKHSYGVSKQAIDNVLNKGIPGVLVIEPQGANNVALFCAEQNISLHKVFINNPMDILVSRLQKRYETDEKAKEEVYKDRLWNIAFIEPKEWTQKAYSGEHHYDQVFDSFTPENEKQVLFNILENIQNKNKQKKKPKF